MTEAQKLEALIIKLGGRRVTPAELKAPERRKLLTT